MQRDIILHMSTINENHMMYGSWQLGRDRQTFSSLWTIFCLFHSNSSENQNFEKMKKTPRDIIILHKSIEIHDHVLYCSRGKYGYNCYFSIWVIFLPFYPLTTQKIYIKKMKKTSGDIIILQMCTKNYD